MFLLFLIFFRVLSRSRRGSYCYFEENEEALEDLAHGRLDVGVGRFEEVV